MEYKSDFKKPLKTFSVSEERVRRLENVLDNGLDALKEPELKKEILRPFRFEVPVALIELYDRKNKRRTKLIEDLEEFFFVGEVYFYPEPEPELEEPKLFGLILVSRFRYLLEVATYYAKKYNGQFDRFPDLSWILFGTPFEKVAGNCSQKRIKKLKTVLNNNQDLLTDGYAVEDILKAFTVKKPVTSIELGALIPTVVKSFTKELEEFFFVRQGFSEPDLLDYVFSGNIFVSRFGNLVEVITYYSHKHHGVLDRFADLAGFFLLGKPPIEIAQYCFKRDLYYLIK